MFIGDVGRPDLRASLGWTANDLGAHLYDSLHNKLLTLPETPWSFTPRMAPARVSTLGEQRRLNYALQPMAKEEFIRLVTTDQPEAPQYFTYDAILNTRERVTLDTNLEKVLRPVALDEVLRLSDAGAHLLDVREAAEFAQGHLASSINILHQDGITNLVEMAGGLAAWDAAKLRVISET